MKFYLTLFILAGSVLFGTKMHGQAEEITSMADWDLSLAYQQYGAVNINKSVTGEPLSIAGEKFSTGIGVQANSKIKIRLGRRTTKFTCKIGINDRLHTFNPSDMITIPLTDGTMIFYNTEQKTGKKEFAGIGSGNGDISQGSVVFKVIADGEEVYNSGIMKQGDKPRVIDLAVRNKNILELIVDDAGDGVSGDHADWIEPLFTFTQIKPSLLSIDHQAATETMPAHIEKQLKAKINQLQQGTIPSNKVTTDWLVDNTSFKTEIHAAHDGKDIVLTNGLISRVFRIFPNLATIDFINHMNEESLLRAVSNEGSVKIDGKTYMLGGLEGQKEFGYTQYEWVDSMYINPNSFRVTDFSISDLTPHIKWANKRWSLVKPWEKAGKVLTFHLEGPELMNKVKVKLHYALYDGMPCISKWMEVENQTGLTMTLDEFMLEQLAMVEPESPVKWYVPEPFLRPNIHVESDWGFHGFIEREADRTEYWNIDARYTSQCNYAMVTPCMLEVKLPMGPDEIMPNGSNFQSFRTWIMPFDSYERERKGLSVQRMYKTIAPWTTENPIFMHCTSSKPEVVKAAVDQCVDTGYEMIIISFGSGLNMEDESEENYAKYKELTEYANSKGIELGCYSLLSSRWISDEVDVINPETGKRGGMIFGSSPCLSSEWGYEYFRKMRTFMEKTGMTVFENDGSYPGNVCASTEHAHHKGLKDSQWKQRKQIADLYQWMCETGIYTNIPDYGYLLNGASKTSIGYREVNWSLPRERQLVLGRQVLYDGLWEKLPSMCWTFVPLTQYHGGGAAATIEPLKDHIPEYKAHMMQNYGSGVQAFYRGHRLYDTEETKAAVVEVIDWYKKYRNILNSELIHLRRADGRNWDGFMHVNPSEKEKGLALFFNPTDQPITRKISLPLYYTGIAGKAKIREKEGNMEIYDLDSSYHVSLTVTIPAKGYTWYVIEE